MERLRPERRPRQRVQTVWRSVCWADTFSEESLIMDTIETTPEFALRKIATLFENKRYEECSSLIRRLNHVMVQAILKEVPIDVVHEALPQSACIIEALYVKVYNTCPYDFPSSELRTDQLIKRIVCIFAKQYALQKGDKNSNTYMPSFRTVLGIIMAAEPDFRCRMVRKKKNIDQCLVRLGQHGMVDSSGGRLMNLHDALKMEFDRVVLQYKCALQKLEELSLSAKHPTSSSVTSGKAPTSGSHHRLMQMTRADVQDRLIKNKTLLNVVDPAISNQYLKHLIGVLQKRIEYDKLMLFHDTEIRKMSGIAEDVFLSFTMRQFSQGYGALLQVLREITGDEFREEEMNGDCGSSEDELAEFTAPVMRKSATHVNGSIPNRDTEEGSSDHQQMISPSFQAPNTAVATPCRCSQSLPREMTTSFPAKNPDSITTTTNKAIPTAPTTTRDDVTALHRDVERLRCQLADAQDQIRKSEEREAQLKARLSEHIHKQFTVNSGGFENICAGDGKRPTELIRQYGNLYTDGRVDAMDALSSLPPLANMEILKMKILFSVIVLSFRAAEQLLQDLRCRVRQTLHIPSLGAASANLDPSSRDLERHVGHYLSQTAERFDTTKCVQDVCEQIYLTLYDYPCLKDCAVLVEYIRDCVRLAWSLSVLNPSYGIIYDNRTFFSSSHTRFHTSDAQRDQIECFLWPTLVEQSTGAVMHKGVVIT